MEMPEGLGNMVVMLPALYVMNKIDFEKEDNILYLRIAFVVAQVFVVTLSLFILSRIKSKNDSTKLVYTPTPPPSFGTTPPPAEPVETTNMAYDIQMFWKMFQQTAMSLGIVCFIHYQWAITAALFMQVFMGPQQLIGQPLFKLHVLNKAVERPFKEPASPFAALLNPAATAATAAEPPLEASNKKNNHAKKSPSSVSKI